MVDFIVSSGWRGYRVRRDRTQEAFMRSPEQQLQQQIEAWQALQEKLGGNE
ncbi:MULTISPECIES: hypothetical protein [Cyanophyceae]|uniref:hypothetical protein n=1 Tax=Cyanophyceae TaxID=3028117 RepID=UPI0016850132|nr:hypothetical protein [Trichocoleus sp. FACHB-69]MBD1931028.1 hypothetical protein [Trichocoleus sp. FACHB-69]